MPPNTESISASLDRSGWLKGFIRALPIVFGYLPVGFAYGILAQKSGLSVFNALMMSIIVFAGASQFIAVGLMAAGASPFSIIVTTFVVNLRHLIMAAAISIRLKGWRFRERAAFSYELTDETFALHITQPTGDFGKAQVFAVNLTAQISWILGTLIGAFAGEQVADIRPYALDYALCAMFIALIVLQIRKRMQIAVVLVSGGLALALMRLGMDQWHVILATLVGATVGAGIDAWTRKKSS